MTVTETRTYLNETYGIAVTGQTVRNWISRGRQGFQLPESPTKEQVDAFLDKLGEGAKFGRGRPCVR